MIILEIQQAADPGPNLIVERADRQAAINPIEEIFRFGRGESNGKKTGAI